MHHSQNATLTADCLLDVHQNNKPFFHSKATRTAEGC